MKKGVQNLTIVVSSILLIILILYFSTLNSSPSIVQLESSNDSKLLKYSPTTNNGPKYKLTKEGRNVILSVYLGKNPPINSIEKFYSEEKGNEIYVYIITDEPYFDYPFEHEDVIEHFKLKSRNINKKIIHVYTKGQSETKFKKIPIEKTQTK